MAMLNWPMPPEPQAAAAMHIQVSGLSKRYPGQQNDALREVTLEVEQGTIFGVIGRSGAGKSSLIRCLNRLEEPSAGRVVIDGVAISELTASELVQWRRGTGMIFQHFNLMSAKTVRENVELPMRVAGVPKAQRRQKAEELLALVGLSEKAEVYPAQLSGGQKQRVGIARALVHDPKLLLCDEATSALDPETTRSVLALLRDINQRKGITIVLITHEMEVIHDLCHQVAVLDQGKIVEQGPVWQVYGDPRHETTRQLLAPARGTTMLPGKLSAKPYGDSCRALICLRYSGQGATPQLAKLSALLGEELLLLESALEWIQERQTGHLLLLTAAGRGGFNPAIIPAKLADRVEVLGYVAAN
ncbi:methionine ABC transporter ATP-binding protein [Kalamiella sp. sgz302252]|uniref:methionine ABC transporter ATP-binding protein n=1 Tax=Pantoea sp. sgz302252 TaxID=3341827 RepID=UPI0036D34FCF